MQMNSIILVLKSQADMKVFVYTILAFVFMGVFTLQFSIEKSYLPQNSVTLNISHSLWS